MLTTVMILLLVTLFLGLPMMMPFSITSIYMLFTKLRFVKPMFFIQQFIGSIEPYVLLCIPMFIFTAEVITRGEMGDRLVDFVKSWIGHVSGGLAITTSVACTIFGAISGSTQATVAAIGKPMRKKMLEAGYDDSGIMGLIINASDIAVLIPPSSVMVVYAVVTGTSVGELFIAGIVPGLVICLLFSIFSFFDAKMKRIPVQPQATWRERFVTARRALLAFGFPVIILGGIYSGIFSPTEAAAAATLYALIIELFIYRKVKLSDLAEIALSTALVTAVVFALVGIGGAFSVMLSYARIPQMITLAALGTDPSALRILITVSIFFFIGCMFVDGLVVTLIVTPFFFPIAMKAGIDPVLLGIIITLQVATGTATPPFGCDIFTAIAVFDRPYLKVVRKAWPFVIILVGVGALLIFVPEVTLWLRDLAFGRR
jgi:tripartite ATP-independent transporter DctM subunit